MRGRESREVIRGAKCVCIENGMPGSREIMRTVNEIWK